MEHSNKNSHMKVLIFYLSSINLEKKLHKLYYHKCALSDSLMSLSRQCGLTPDVLNYIKDFSPTIHKLLIESGIPMYKTTEELTKMDKLGDHLLQLYSQHAFCNYARFEIEVDQKQLDAISAYFKTSNYDLPIGDLASSDQEFLMTHPLSDEKIALFLKTFQISLGEIKG